MKPMRYEFEAMTERGAEVVDVVYAATEREAARLVREQGLFLTKFLSVDGARVKKARMTEAKPSWFASFCKLLRDWLFSKMSWFCRSRKLAQPVLSVN